jgi:para-nitrobenzyl esterase
MLATSAAKGLFHKAIVESGSQLAVQGRPEATRTARLVLAELGVDSADATALDALSSEALHAAATSIESRLGELAFQPVLDGDVLTHQTWTPAAPAESAGIPMIIGTTSQEGAGFLPKMREPITSDGEMIARFRESLVGGALSDPQIQSTTDRYRQILPKATRLELLVAIVTDTFMLHSAIIQAERKVAQGQEAVYVYEFAWKTPCFGATWALHGIELPFVFGNLRYGVAWDSADSESVRAVADPHNDRVRLAKETMRAWTAFAHTGSPSTRALPWPAYNLGDRRTMVFDHVSRVLADPAEARRKVLADLPPAW